MGKKEGKRKAYDAQFKKNVVKWYLEDKNRSLQDAANHFELNLETVKSFYRRRDSFISSNDKRKKMRSAMYPALESDVLKFVRLARSLRLPVTGNAIQVKALSLRIKHAISEDQFKASRGWLHNFISRSGIQDSIRLYGEAGEVDKDSVREEMKNVSEKLSKYSPENIYNEDETGFVYQCLPNITYLAPEESKKEARGSKAMRRKERITIATCTNSDGSHVLPPFFIGKSKRPVCFALSNKKDQLETHYKNNKTAWMTGLIFNYYLEFVWYPSVRKRTSKNVCMLLDNCSAHGDSLPQLPGVEYIFLPPNVTSVYQPLDMGVLRVLKVNARRYLLSQILSNVEQYKELYELGKLQKGGMRGVAYCHPAHILDAIRAMHHAYSLLKQTTVAKCWIKTGILVPSQVATICERIGIPFPSSYEDTPGNAARTERCSNPSEQLQTETSTNNLEEELCTASSEFADIIQAISVADGTSDARDVEQEIANWLSDVSNLEQNVAQIVDKDPESIVKIIDEAQHELDVQEKERVLIEEKEKELAAELNEKEKEKACYATLRANADWLETILKEAQPKSLDDEVYAKLIDVVRVAKFKARAAAPAKKQKFIAEFFKSA